MKFNSMLGKNLKEARKRRGYTQEQVAREVGVEQGAVAHWESGRRDIPSSKLYKLSLMFEVSIGDLTGSMQTEKDKLVDARLKQLENQVKELQSDPKEPSDTPHVVEVSHSTKPH